METVCMNSIASRIACAATAVLLLAAAIGLAACRVEYCGQPESQQPMRLAACDTHQPTPAPPRQVVFLRVEADEGDLEIGWAEK
jgi:hypothetical protein